MLILALIATVILLVWMGFFMMGSLPLMILKHDTPLDARFIRGLFNVYYTALVVTGSVAALSYVFAGKPNIAVALASVALLGIAGRRWMVGQMDRVRGVMTPEDRAAIWQFRRLHIAGMVINVVLLASFCVGMTKVKL